MYRPLQWPSRGGGGSLPRRVSARGGVCLGGVCPGSVFPRGCLPRVGVSDQEGCLSGGGCLPRGGCLHRGCVCLGDVCLGVCTPPCGQNSRHTLVKTLPFRNFVYRRYTIEYECDHSSYSRTITVGSVSATRPTGDSDKEIREIRGWRKY